jgi:deoxycytidine triphosphate deaminase
MILPDSAIRRALDTGEISVEPPARDIDIRSAGVRVHLSPDLLIPIAGDQEIDLAAPGTGQFLSHRMGADGYVLESHGFALAATSEKIRYCAGSMAAAQLPAAASSCTARRALWIIFTIPLGQSYWNFTIAIDVPCACGLA